VWERNPDPVAFERIVVDAVYECYKQIPRSVLQIDASTDMRKWIAETWLNILEDLKNPNIHLLVAKKGMAPLGYAFFDLSDYPRQVYIGELAVDPQFKRQGIAKELVQSVLWQLPEVEKVYVITRKANFQACGFYKALGFVPSSYIKDDYDKALFTGFVLYTKD
jgi:ribosomal protein S18 acetylase RimI-like enzyme